MKDIMRDELAAPKIVDRSTFPVELDPSRVREKAHTREGDAAATHLRAATNSLAAEPPHPRFHNSAEMEHGVW